MSYARALLPTLLCSYAALLLATTLYPDCTVGEHLNSRTTCRLCSLQQFLPILVSILHNLFARATRDTTQHDRIHNVKADLPSLRRACLVVGVASAATLQYIRYRTSNGTWLRNIFSAGPLYPQALPALLVEIASHEHFAFYPGAMLWLALLFGDLKKAGMVKESWAWLLVCAVACTAIIGPSATLVAGWAWREEILASKRHRAAIVKDG